MSRQRRPIELRLVEGSLRRDRHTPARLPFESLPPLGEPPQSWPAARKEIWREVCDLIPANVAFRSDRIVVEICVRLIEQMRARPAQLSCALAAQLRVTLGSLALTPSDRTKFATPEPPSDTDSARSFVRDRPTTK